MGLGCIHGCAQAKAVRRFERLRRFGGTNMSQPIQFTTDYSANRRESVQVWRFGRRTAVPSNPPWQAQRLRLGRSPVRQGRDVSLHGRFLDGGHPAKICADALPGCLISQDLILQRTLENQGAYCSRAFHGLWEIQVLQHNIKYPY